MKALLIKDFLTLSKMILTIVILLLIFACIPQFNMSVFFMVYCTMLPVTALGFDERTKWDTLAAMMPYRPQEIVLGKYVLGYILLAVVTALALLAVCVVGLVTGAPAAPGIYLSGLLYAAAATNVLAITLPLVYRFGVEKGRLAFGIGIGVGISLFIALVLPLMDNADMFMLTRGQLIALILAFTVLLNLLSIRLSIQFYRRKLA